LNIRRKGRRIASIRLLEVNNDPLERLPLTFIISDGIGARDGKLKVRRAFSNTGLILTRRGALCFVCIVDDFGLFPGYGDAIFRVFGTSRLHRMTLVGACRLFCSSQGWRSSAPEKVAVMLERVLFGRVFWTKFVQDFLREHFLPRKGAD
jgi:hypothetical protein